MRAIQGRPQSQQYSSVVAATSPSKHSEKAISCCVCLTRIPVSQLRCHELECRARQLAGKKGSSRVTGGGGSMIRQPMSAVRKPMVKVEEPEPVKVIRRPMTLMCFICGREYGTKSLPIHLKTCEKNWETQQSQKPLRDRRAIPTAPPGIQQLLAKDIITSKDIQSYNNRAFDQYNYDVLVPCQHCGRTFKPESLIPHQKSCKASNPLKPMSDNQKSHQIEAQYAMANGNMQLVECHKCGRKFASDRVSKHESVCKPGPTKFALRNQMKMQEKTQKLARIDRKYEAAAKQSNWRQQHAELQESMKQVRMMNANGGGSGGSQRGNNIAPQQNYSQSATKGLKECPHCYRRFNPDTAAKHIPICKNTINRPSPVPGRTHQITSIGQSYKEKPSVYNEKELPYVSTSSRQVAAGHSKISSVSYNSNPMTSPTTKTYKIANTNERSSYNNNNIFSTGTGDRNSWMKQMGSKQQKTHDNLYGISSSSQQVSNSTPFPAPKGSGGGRMF